MKLKSESILLIVIVICSSVAGQGNTADDWIKKGWALNNVESYTEAAECFDNAILLNSSSPEAWDGKGFALNGEGYKKDDAQKYTEARGYYEEAKRCFERAIQLNSSYLNAYIDMADSENKLDNYERALELLDKALRINPNNAEVINVKGTVFYSMGKYDEALELFRKATTIDPKCVNAWSNICDFIKQHKKEDPDAAAEADDACQKAAAIYNDKVGH